MSIVSQQQQQQQPKQFQNIYYKRATATPKACYICNRPTTTVLATNPATDFLYTCDNHLADKGFCNKIPVETPPISPSPVTDAEIAAVKKEWDEKQKVKAEASQQKDSKEDKEDKEDKDKDKEIKKSSQSPPPNPPAPIAPPSLVPLHTRFALHREIFAMRLAEHRRVRYTKAATDLAPRLPTTPLVPPR